MPTVDQAVDEFLALKRIAVAGVSRSPGGSHASNGICSRPKEHGYQVFPVNPNADKVMGDTCYKSLKDIPGGVNGVVIATNPSATLSVAQECKELGIDKVWIHKNIRRRKLLEGSARLLSREWHHRPGELPAVVWRDIGWLPQVLRRHVPAVAPGLHGGLTVSPLTREAWPAVVRSGGLQVQTASYAVAQGHPPGMARTGKG